MLDRDLRNNSAWNHRWFVGHNSEEPMEENIEICVEYLERMAKMDMLLEMELGITGGEEDGVNNEDVNPEDLCVLNHLTTFPSRPLTLVRCT